MAAPIQICLDTLAFDQIDEIIQMNGQPTVKLVIYTPFSQYCFESYKQIKEFYDYVQHVQKHGFMMITLDQKQIDSLQNHKDQKKTISTINLLIQELLIRRDLIIKQRTIQLLGLNQNVEVFCKEQAIIPNYVMGFKMSESGLTVTQVLIANQLLILTLENQSQLQKFGKIWNLIEPEILGQILVFQIGEITPFQKLLDRHYSVKLFCMEQVKKQILVGTCQGIIYFYDIISEQQVQECRQVQVITSPIYKIKYFNSELYLVSDQAIKIIDQNTYELIGGGSLKNRLQTAWITCMNFDEQEKLLFLGASQGFILVYKRTQKLEFLQQIAFNINMSIKSIQLVDYYIYPCTDYAVPIIKYKLSENKFEYEEKTAFTSSLVLWEFIKRKNTVIGITNCGMIVQWNSDNGKMNQAYKLDKNCLVALFNNNDLFVATSDQMLHVVNFQ